MIGNDSSEKASVRLTTAMREKINRPTSENMLTVLINNFNMMNLLTQLSYEITHTSSVCVETWLSLQETVHLNQPILGAMNVENSQDLLDLVGILQHELETHHAGSIKAS